MAFARSCCGKTLAALASSSSSAGTVVSPPFVGTGTGLPFTVIRAGSEPFGIDTVFPFILEPCGKPST